MPRSRHAAVTRILLATVAAALAARPAFPVEPGIDIAAPKVAISTVDAATLLFHPATLVVEQNDHVRWRWTGGSHNTTSATTATSCTASGLWASALNSITTSLTRQFTEPPATFPYFCQPHCGLGMRGQVVVTSGIGVLVKESGAAVQLDWTGGGGLYRIFRSTSPLFTSGTTTVLTGAAGTNAASFVDSTAGTPPVGSVHFYLVMNHF